MAGPTLLLIKLSAAVSQSAFASASVQNRVTGTTVISSSIDSSETNNGDIPKRACNPSMHLAIRPNLEFILWPAGVSAFPITGTLPLALYLKHARVGVFAPLVAERAHNLALGNAGGYGRDDGRQQVGIVAGGLHDLTQRVGSIGLAA